MTGGPTPSVPPKESGNARLSLLQAAAMFVLVVDTSLMNVSISAAVEDLDTRVSEPPAVREEILGMNTDATNLALQIALLVPSSRVCSGCSTRSA